MEGGLLYKAAAFKLLDPLLKDITGDCSIKTAAQVKEIIPKIDIRSLQELHAFILIPLLGEVANNKHDKEIKTALLNCVNEVLTRVRINSVSVVKNIMTMLMMEIFDKDSPTMIRNVPEEMKLSVMNCAFSTICNMSFEVQDKYYVRENVPEICQIAYTCLELAMSEKLRPLKLRAMDVVVALQQIPLDGPDKRSQWERQKVGDIFQFILPGACSKLMSIVSGDITQGSKVLSSAIFTVSSMIALVMEDYSSDNSMDPAKMIVELMQMQKPIQDESSKCVEEVNALGAKKMIESSKGRTPEWRTKIASHLLPYLSKIGAQWEHSDPKVCKMVVRACCLIISRSPVSLKEGLAPLLDAIMALSVHEDAEVREECVSSIKVLTDTVLKQNGYDFIQLAEENFYMLLTRLPRLVQEEGSARGASSIALLSGYVQLLNPSLRNILSCSAHLHRLILSLLHVVTLECSNIVVGNEHTMRELSFERYEDINVPWTQLRFSSDRAVLTNISLLFDFIVEESIGVFEIIGSQLMDSFHSILQLRKESILLLNMFLVSACRMQNKNATELGTALLELYMTPDFWPAKENLRSGSRVAKAQQDIAIVCLLTEGIGICIHSLDKSRAQAQLLRVLYPLVEQAGSANSCISLAGRRALSHIASACDFGNDVMALISKNMDYLSYCMSVRLRHVHQYLDVLDALSLILLHSSPEIAVGLYKIVKNVLDQSSDVNERQNNEAHLRVFLTFALGVEQWLRPNSHSATEETGEFVKSNVFAGGNDKEKLTGPNSRPCLAKSRWKAVQNLKKYQENLRIQLRTIEDSVDCQRNPTDELAKPMQPHFITTDMEEDNSMDDSPDEKKDIPELAKLLELVLKRCLHFLPSPITQHQFLAMKTLEAGLKALEPYTNTVLPIIHLVWSPLVGRFEANQSPLVIRTAFQLLLTMAMTAKDFLLSRTVREVFPQLSKFLSNAAHESHLKDCASVYRFSQKYKTQLALLEGIGPVSCHLQISGQDFYSMLSVSLLYLSCQQPRPLQAAAVSSIRSLFSLDADAVWWALVSWWAPPTLAPMLGLPLSSQHRDCEENVRILLDTSVQCRKEDTNED